MMDDVKKRKQQYKRESEQKDVEWIGAAKDGVIAVEANKAEN